MIQRSFVVAAFASLLAISAGAQSADTTVVDSITIIVSGDSVTVSRVASGDARADLEVFSLRRSAADFQHSLPDVVELRLDSLIAMLPPHARAAVEEANLPRLRFERRMTATVASDLADAEQRSRELAAELHKAREEGRVAEAERLQSELLATIEEAFDMRQQARRERLEAMRRQEARLAEEADALEASIQRREDDRAAIIRQRASELQAAAADRGW